MEATVMENNGTILSITRTIAPRGEYPGSYRVMWECEDGGPKTHYSYVDGMDELDAYRRFKRWLALPYPEERGNVAPARVRWRLSTVNSVTTINTQGLTL